MYNYFSLVIIIIVFYLIVNIINTNNIENFGFDLGAFPDVMLHADPDNDPEPERFSGSDNLPQLSVEQLAAKRQIIGLIGISETLASRSNVVAVVARAGTGKSVWVHHVTNELRLQNKTCICVAASALAATVLPAGQTAHAAFNIPVPCLDNTFLIWNESTKRRIKRASVIFWDEISMVAVH
jgi:hypothetical protein